MKNLKSKKEEAKMNEEIEDGYPWKFDLMIIIMIIIGINLWYTKTTW